MTDTETLTDDQLREIEARWNAATPGPWQARFIYRLFESARRDPVNLFGSGPEQDWPDSEFIANARADMPALCATVRALREKRSQLTEVSGEWARLLDRIRLWSKCEDGYPLDEHINNLATQNTALREQLADAIKARDLFVSLKRGQTERADELYVRALGLLKERDDLQSQLAQVTQERDRLQRGDFTSEEFQNLCHNTDVQVGFDAFADGCEAYQQKMFGRCRTKGRVL